MCCSWMIFLSFSNFWYSERKEYHYPESRSRVLDSHYETEFQVSSVENKKKQKAKKNEVIASLFSIGLFPSTIFFFFTIFVWLLAISYIISSPVFVDLQSTLSIPLCMRINVQLMVIAD